jgi:DNA-binding IscR family transcriptional regulator
MFKSSISLPARIRQIVKAEGGAVSIKTVCERLPFKVSDTYVEKFLVEMRDCGLVVSSRGRYGGYRLEPGFDEITLGELAQMIGVDAGYFVGTEIEAQVRAMRLFGE